MNSSFEVSLRLSQAKQAWGEGDGLLYQVEQVQDSFDLVVNDNNLSAEIAADQILVLLLDLCVGARDLLQGAAKVIIALPEEPWEFTLLTSTPGYWLLSIYSLASPSLPAHNLPISASSWVDALINVSRELVDTLHYYRRVAADAPLALALVALEQAAAGLEEIAIPIASPPHVKADPQGTEVVLRSPLEDGLQLELSFGAHPRDMMAYQGVEPFDWHALLLQGALRLVGSAEPTLLYQGPGLVLCCQRLLYLFEELPLGRGRSYALGGWRLKQAKGGFYLKSETAKVIQLGKSLPLALATLTELLIEWLSETNPKILKNQRLIELRETAEAVVEAVEAQAAEDYRASSTSLRALQVVEAGESIKVELPFGVKSQRLRRVFANCTWDAPLSFAVNNLLLIKEKVLACGQDESAVMSCHNGHLDARLGALLSYNSKWLLSLEPHAVWQDNAANLWLSSLQPDASPGRASRQRYERGPIVASRYAFHLVEASGDLIAFTPHEDRLLWRASPGKLSALMATGERLLAGNKSGRLSAYASRDGKVLWRIHTGFSPCAMWRLSKTVVLRGFELEEGREQLRAYALVDGREQWTLEIPEKCKVLLLNKALLLLRQRKKGQSLSCLNEDGSQRWRHQLEDGALLEHLEFGGQLYLASSSGKLHALESSSGKALWQRQLWADTGVQRFALREVEGQLLAYGGGGVLLSPQGLVLSEIVGLPSEPWSFVLAEDFSFYIAMHEGKDLSALRRYEARHFLALV